MDIKIKMGCCGGAKVSQIVRAYRNMILRKNQALSQSRMDICNQCELLKNGWCQACNCFMMAKTTLKDKNVKCEHPDGAKW